ncbi:MAG: 3-deoxy-manno-octulosonate cytidylyltransferase [Pseudomonadota bacterium]
MTNFTVVIPARYASVRFPGKPLHELAGRAMVLRVADQAVKAGATQVVVATDDERIAAAVRDDQVAGVRVALTDPTHASGTDRVQEAARQLGLAEDDIVVNVQGDEPLIPPVTIRQAAELVAEGPADAASLWAPISTREELLDPNAVKVVVAASGLALYFSRSPIPFLRDVTGWDRVALAPHLQADTFKRHVGLYAYRVRTLNRFVTLPEAPLEQLERLEQLRLLDQGIALRLAQAVEPIPAGVDTPEDAQRINDLLAS